MINQLIDKIVIYQKEKLKRYKFPQRIDIYFNFIGKFEIEKIEKDDEIKEESHIEKMEDKKYIHKYSRFLPISKGRCKKRNNKVYKLWQVKYR